MDLSSLRQAKRAELRAQLREELAPDLVGEATRKAEKAASEACGVLEKRINTSIAALQRRSEGARRLREKDRRALHAALARIGALEKKLGVVEPASESSESSSESSEGSSDDDAILVKRKSASAHAARKRNGARRGQDSSEVPDAPGKAAEQRVPAPTYARGDFVVIHYADADGSSCAPARLDREHAPGVFGVTWLERVEGTQRRYKAGLRDWAGRYEPKNFACRLELDEGTRERGVFCFTRESVDEWGAVEGDIFSSV